MNDIINRLFEASEREGDFAETDTVLNNECEKRLNPYEGMFAERGL